MRLFHFSDDGGIREFQPRPVRTPVERPAGREWLNGPLVWAIDEIHEPLYLFPRECPRILAWATPGSTDADRRKWLGDSSARMIAWIEHAWYERFRSAIIHRYELPVSSFEDIGDVGMWVSRHVVSPVHVSALTGLRRHLDDHRTELRVVDSLIPLKDIWRSSVHASGIRLRNAPGWGNPGWPHSGADAPNRTERMNRAHEQ
jgi:hypothetical protein